MYRHTFLTRWSDRLMRWSRLCLFVTPFSVLTAGIVNIATEGHYADLVPLSIGFAIAWGVLCFAVFAVFELVLSLGKQRMVSMLIQSRCRRCPKCFYDLSQRPREDKICPECGITTPRRECVWLWCKLLRTRF